MSTGKFGRSVDAELENRVRETLVVVAATIEDDPVGSPADTARSAVPPASASLVGHAERPGPWWRHRSARLVAAAAVTALAASTVTALASDRQAVEAIALGDGALSQPVRDGGNVCLAEARELGQIGKNDRPYTVNYFRHPWLSVVVYQNGERLIYCTVNESPTGEETAVGSVGGYSTDALMRGPVSPELMETQGVEGEYMAVAGRVSPRVARVAFDDGAGRVRQANLVNGTFATAGDYARRDQALLISYDRDGKEIDRRLAFGISCDAAYEGTPDDLPGTVCEPHERWTPRATPQQVA